VRRQLYLVLPLIFLLALVPRYAYACSLGPESLWMTTAEKVAKARIIFTGEIIDIEPGNPYGETTVVRVDTYYRAGLTVPSVVKVNGWGTNCGEIAEVGDRWIFYTTRDNPGNLQLAFLTGVDRPAVGTLKEIEHITGKAPLVVIQDGALIDKPLLIGTFLILSLPLTVFLIKKRRTNTA
jgi:hypothetical protein